MNGINFILIKHFINHCEVKTIYSDPVESSQNLIDIPGIR